MSFGDLMANRMPIVCERLGEDVTITTPTGSFSLKALVEYGLDEFGMEEIFITMPYGDWFDAYAANKSATTLTLRGIAYKITDARDIVGAYEVRLERAQ